MDLSAAVTLLLAVCISSLIMVLGFKVIWKSGNLPPGPTPLPFLGNILQLRKRGIVQSLMEKVPSTTAEGGWKCNQCLELMLCIINFLMQMREKYGDVFMIYLGSRPVVVVNGYQSVKEALVDRGDDFLARGEIPALDAVYKDYGMVLTSNLARWRKLRSFSVTTLRGLGMGKRSIEERIQEEAQHLVTELRKNKESIFDPQKCIGKATCNIICSIMFGSRYEYEDEELLSLIMWIHETFQTISSAWGQLYEMFPWIMKYLPGQYNKVFTLMEKLLWFVEKRVKMNQKTLDASNPRDYIDAFLIQMEKIPRGSR
ncbi:hypothetical protein FKM82_021500 [Ascaphus truei]